MTAALLSASAPTAAGALALSLGRAALEGGLLVLVVAAIVRAFPRLNAATRTALWWLACLRLVAGLVAWPAPSLPLPALPESPRELVRTSLAATPQLAPAGDAFARFTRPVDTESRERTLAWSDVTRLAGTLGRAAAPGLLALWACGVLAALALHVLAAHRARKLWNGATPFEHPHAHDWLASWLGSRAAARIELRVSASSCDVVINDSGPGVRADVLAKIFEPFFQVDGSMTRQHEGAGVGLAIVRRVVEAHGGTVSAETGGRELVAGQAFGGLLLRLQIGRAPRSPTEHQRRGEP